MGRNNSVRIEEDTMTVILKFDDWSVFRLVFLSSIVFEMVHNLWKQKRVYTGKIS